MRKSDPGCGGDTVRLLAQAVTQSDDVLEEAAHATTGRTNYTSYTDALLYNFPFQTGLRQYLPYECFVVVISWVQIPVRSCRLMRLGFSWFSMVLQGKYRHNTTNQATTASFQILSNLLFTNPVYRLAVKAGRLLWADYAAKTAGEGGETMQTEP
jgi:hypothetical protein